VAAPGRHLAAPPAGCTAAALRRCSSPQRPSASSCSRWSRGGPAAGTGDRLAGGAAGPGGGGAPRHLPPGLCGGRCGGWRTGGLLSGSGLGPADACAVWSVW
jgi:hypothetical protein